jgi:hypothetical protein
VLIRITSLPIGNELEEYDLRRFEVGGRYDVQAQFASVLIISGHAEPLSSASVPVRDVAADFRSRTKR